MPPAYDNANAVVGPELLARLIDELIQQSDAPNLYWSLTALPRPLVDMQPAMEFESMSVYLMFPRLRDPLLRRLTAEPWNAEAEALLERLSSDGSTNCG